jgi:hypothetical protein
MKLSYTTADGRMTVEVEGKSQTDLFEQLAEFQDAFEVGSCIRGKKSSDKVKFQVREVEGNKFYEMVCTDEDFDLKGARLSFGQHKKGGTLFVKRKDKDGKWLNNNGWVKYNKETGKEE